MLRQPSCDIPYDKSSSKHQTKLIDIWHHYIQEQYEDKVVEPFHIAGEENPADLFTKSLPIINVEKFRSKIRLS